jgi:hypothetical protein
MSVGPSASGAIGPSTVCTWPRGAALVTSVIAGLTLRRGRAGVNAGLDNGGPS